MVQACYHIVKSVVDYVESVAHNSIDSAPDVDDNAKIEMKKK